MHAKTAVCLAALLFATGAWAQSDQPAPATPSSVSAPPLGVVQLQAVTVRGEQPGPALWEVRRDEHVMWIIGTLSPLPRHADWQWTKLEKALGRSSELLEAPSARLKMPPSLYSRLALQPSARLNPGGATLQRLLAPEVYARWRELRKQYLGDDDAYEYMRPIVVAEQLYTRALASSDLTDETDVPAMVEKLAHKHGTRVIGVRYELIVKKAPVIAGGVDQEQKQGIACLDETMHMIEEDLPKLTQRANAWATGDMKTLQSIMQDTHYEPCVVAAINGDFEHQLAIPDLPKRIEDAWFEAARSALVRNRYTVAILSMEQLMAPDGYLAKLKALGYNVRLPEGLQQP
ncbi:MAG TPA: TraB/GumN family protein [Dyella sp.]|uniref:TraB/GumN family protein n=1 Tax=Dyella sp. TaxID=1869338 RepID=UPI002D765829|nr:TraB/GumN family protein [Dyella sp.]HET6554039.1 TraB/GumN family protein [Dyella sp.]